MGGLGTALVSLVLVSAPVAVAYDRLAWMPGGWLDVDHNCRNTREEVLRRQAVGPVVGDGCRLRAGVWLDPYSGTAITDPMALDVDHVVPLGYVDAHGGASWAPAKKKAYANDLTPGHLLAVSASLNRAKGDRGPAVWVPPWPAGRCAYGRAWQDVTRRYALALAPEDAAAVTQLLRECPQSGEDRAHLAVEDLPVDIPDEDFFDPETIW